jgi:hypothetical protein
MRNAWLVPFSYNFIFKFLKKINFFFFTINIFKYFFIAQPLNWVVFLKKLKQINFFILQIDTHRANEFNSTKFFSPCAISLKKKFIYFKIAKNKHCLDLNLFKIFNLFFLFSYTSSSLMFKNNYNYNYFFMKTKHQDIITLNLNKLIARWKDAYSLIFNIYYYDLSPLIFGSFFLKFEILSINWKTNFFKKNMWKFNYPFFVYKTNRFNKKNDFFFIKLTALKIDFFFVLDPSYHYKNLYYFKRYNFFTISLIDTNLSPWLVDYPIPVTLNSVLIQFFFLKILIFLKKNSNYLKFQFFKNYWLLANFKKLIY